MWNILFIHWPVSNLRSFDALTTEKDGQLFDIWYRVLKCPGVYKCCETNTSNQCQNVRLIIITTLSSRGKVILLQLSVLNDLKTMTNATDPSYCILRQSWFEIYSCHFRLCKTRFPHFCVYLWKTSRYDNKRINFVIQSVWVKNGIVKMYINSIK